MKNESASRIILPQAFNRLESDLDVDIRPQARQLDGVPRQDVELHRQPHDRHEDISALGAGPGLEDQSHRFRDRHEVPDDIRTGHRHRTAHCDLLFKNRDHRPVAPRHTPEPYRHELRACVPVKGREGRRHPVLLLPRTGPINTSGFRFGWDSFSMNSSI